MNSRRFEAIIFDLGNTLLHFDGEWPEVFQKSDAELLGQLHAAGFNLGDDIFIKQFRTRLEKYFFTRESDLIEYTTAAILRGLLEEWGHGDVPEEVINKALAAMYAVSQAHWKPELDAIPTLQALKKQNYRLGIISNAGDDADVQTLVDKAKLRPYFDIILTSAAQGIRKPNPYIFQTGLDQIGVEPSRAVMVGDKLEADILGAHNAGMFSIWITRRADIAASAIHEQSIQPNAVINSLIELPALLEKLGT